MITIRTKYLDIPDISEQDWEDFLTLRTKDMKESNPADPVNSHEQQRVELSSAPEWPNYVKWWLVYDEDDNPVATYVVVHPKPDNPDYEANKHIIWVGAYVDEPYRRQGIATQIVPKLVEQAHEFGATVMQAGTERQAGWAFLDSLGAKVAMTERVSRMVMAETDWDMLQRWVDEGKSRNPDVEIIRADGLPPEEDIQAYCDLITELVRTVPEEDMEHEEFTATVEELRKSYKRDLERGDKYVVLYAKDADGSLMGMTGMFHKAEIDTISYVGLTGVLTKYQGRGLGKYLKALMSYDLRDNFPDVKYVNTDNAESNAPMLSINERMNFKPHKQWVAYKINVADIPVRVKST